MKAACTGQPSAREAILVMKAAPASKILADVTDPLHPKTICKLTGGWSPSLVTDSEMSWSASEHRPGTPGKSVIATLDVFSGTASVVATWQGGGYLDGLFAWSPHRDLLVYLVSDATGVDLHLLSGGGDRVVASLGAVPGRGISVTEDDAYLQFSPDGAFFALEQTFASGPKLQIRKATTGAIAYSQASATMASWGSVGSKLYFRHLSSGTIYAWDSASGLVTQPIGQSLFWIKPKADAGDDYLAFTVRDATGAPHVWLYGHGGHSGTQLPNVRSSPEFLTASQVFFISETPCGANCGPGPATLPDGKTFIYDISHQLEVASTIMTVYATWPNPGQV